MKQLTNIALNLLGMSGLRAGRASWRASYMLWVAAFFAAIIAYLALFAYADAPAAHRKGALFYAAAACIYYYGGLAAVLGCGGNRWLIARFGESRARRVYEVVLGIGFVNHALAFGAVAVTCAGSLALPANRLIALAALSLMAAGMAVKLWATCATSLDTYYCLDMFLSRATNPAGEKVTWGPYRWFDNPMYGVGNLPTYGAALLARSWEALVLAAVFQGLIYAFYFAFERPFIARTYGAGAPAPSADPVPAPVHTRRDK